MGANLKFSKSKAVIIISGALLLFLLGSYLYLNNYASTNGPGFGQKIISISRGESAKKIISRLETQQIINSPKAFYFYLRFIKHQASDLRSGEYEFETPLPPSTVIEKLISGQEKKYAVTIPEGANLKDIQNILAQSPVCENSNFDSIFESNLEGYLYPDTYHFSKSECGPKVIEVMKGELEDKIKKLNLDLESSNLHKILILASIIEKETAVPVERARVSGVYHNRLKRNMKLQADPTVIYGIKNYKGNIRYRHLRDKSNKYNTYVHRGLPPGPIANPGIESIKAALSPEKHKYLYFVAKDDGTHVFCKNLKCHNRAVQKWQKRR